MIRIVTMLLGLFAGGLIGAFIGWFLGGIVERFFYYGAGGINPLTNNQRQQVFFKTLFSLAGHLAKADGHVSKEEISHAEHMMQQLGLKETSRKEAVNYFRLGSASQFNLEQCVVEFNHTCGRTRSLRQMLILFLLSLSYADNRLDKAEEKLLYTIASQLNYTRTEFEYLHKMFKNQQNFANSDGKNNEQQLEGAYALLGVLSSDNDAVIKKAYRKQMSQYHPDKLTGQGMPADMIKMATEKSKEIQKAYDLIKKNRS